MTFWQLRGDTQGSVVSSSTAMGGTKVFTNAANAQSWLSSKRLIAVNAQRTYEVTGSFRRPTTTGAAGGIYLAVVLYDGAKAEIPGDGTWWFYPALNLSLSDTAWHTYSGRFGAGTQHPLPSSARYMSVGAVLNYDGAVAGNRNYEVTGLGIQSVGLNPSETGDDGGLALASGTANSLYTPFRTFQQGTYLVFFYNCLTSASHNHFVQAMAEASSGAITTGAMVRDFSQMQLYTQAPFLVRVRSATASVRFKIFNPALSSATLTNGSPSCSQFSWYQIGL